MSFFGRAAADAAYLAPDAEKLLAETALKLSGDTELPVLSQGLWRRATSHTNGLIPDADNNVLVTADSFTMGIRGVGAPKVERDRFGNLSALTGMSKTNLLDQTAAENGFTNLHLHQVSQALIPGLVHVNEWQSPGAGLLTPGGFLNGSRPLYDDAVYGKDAIRALAGKMNIGSLNFAAYGEGAEFLPNLIDEAASLGIPLRSATLVGGTTLGTERLIGKGIAKDSASTSLKHVLLVRGTEDPNFPTDGGAGKNTEILRKLGHTNIDGSQPKEWEDAWKRALGIDAPAQVRLIPGGGTESVSMSSDGRSVTSVTLPMGSTWPGRSYGAKFDSAISSKNGAGSDYNLNSRIAQMVTSGRLARDLVAR